MVACVALLAGCKTAPKEGVALSGLKRADFQAELQGKKTDLYTLRNEAGMEVCVTNFGARVVSIMVPDKEGKLKDVCVGQPSIQAYSTIESDFGATIGRYANRIAGGKITVDGTEYQLPKNNFGHCLHGGCTLDPKKFGFQGDYMGWQYKVMDVEEVTDNSITMTFVSPDGEAGFPGTVKGKVQYTLTNCGKLAMRWTATTDKKTVINTCSHLYFNLNGDYHTPITNHVLALNADNYTPVDATFMTTGEIAPVAGTPMDFTTPKPIGQDISADFEQLRFGKGYDHNWVLNKPCCKGEGKCDKESGEACCEEGEEKGEGHHCEHEGKGGVTLAATLVSPLTGIRMDVFTNEPGIQVYTGNFLDGTVNGKDGKPIEHRTAVCLETQKFPDTPNKSDLEGWPDATLAPGQEYESIVIYQFSTACCKDGKHECKEGKDCDKEHKDCDKEHKDCDKEHKDCDKAEKDCCKEKK
ncbi:MAG: galactose mutarotase [Bacteroidaceae bacterium]|nr:galactose mutarotase [Bacteroidaceae bacterium]